MNKIIKTKPTSDYFCLFLGISIAFIYKFWKVLCRKYTNGFFDDQILFSFFRILSSLGIVFYIRKYRADFIRFFKLSDNFKSLSFIFVYSLVVFVNLYLDFKGFNFDFKVFRFEFFNNFFVGIFEELVFRCLIFLSLRSLLGLKWSMFLSSLIFSFWHYDVVEVSMDYLSIFLFGILASLLLERGFSLIYLILTHALYDTIFLGFLWDQTKITSATISSFRFSVIDFVFIILSLRLFKKVS